MAPLRKNAGIPDSSANAKKSLYYPQYHAGCPQRGVPQQGAHGQIRIAHKPDWPIPDGSLFVPKKGGGAPADVGTQYWRWPRRRNPPQYPPPQTKACRPNPKWSKRIGRKRRIPHLPPPCPCFARFPAFPQRSRDRRSANFTRLRRAQDALTSGHVTKRELRREMLLAIADILLIPKVRNKIKRTPPYLCSSAASSPPFASCHSASSPSGALPALHRPYRSPRRRPLPLVQPDEPLSHIAPTNISSASQHPKNLIRPARCQYQ